MTLKEYLLLWGHSKSTFVEEGRGHWKANKSKQGEGGHNMCVRSDFFKKMVRFSKLSFIVILQFFLLIIMAAWNIKPLWKIIIFSPVNEWRAIAFPSAHKITVGYVKNIYFLRLTLFGAPNENFAFETRCKADTGTKKPFS